MGQTQFEEAFLTETLSLQGTRGSPNKILTTYRLTHNLYGPTFSDTVIYNTPNLMVWLGGLTG